MATIDSNGVLFYQDSDNFTPPASLNLAQSNLSDLLSAGVRFKRVANTTARSALVTSIGLANITTANPLHVWRADATAGRQYEYTTNGTTWHTILTSETPPYDQVLFADANVAIGFRELHGTVTVYAYGTNSLASGVVWQPVTVPAGYRPSTPSAAGILIPRQSDRVMSGAKVGSNGVLTILNRTGAVIDGGWDATVTYVR